jgi:hypothetical protein
VTPDERGLEPLTAQHTLSGDRAALVARLAGLVDVLTHPELVEVRSLLDALARAHRIDTTTTAVMSSDSDDQPTYADLWHDAINDTYEDCDDFINSLGFDEADVSRILSKAADALRNGVPATFTGPELDVVRHLMPAHEVHQSGAKRWLLDAMARAHGLAWTEKAAR